MSAPLEVRLLGPMAVAAGANPVELPQGNERLVVALLALQGGAPTSTDVLIDRLWPDEPPATAREMVRIYIGRARRRIGDDAIVTDAGSYALRVSPDDVDAIRFERTVRVGTAAIDAGAADEAVAALRDALSLWQGEPLAGLPDVEYVQAERRRLHELRLTALEARFAAELQLGSTTRLIPELEALVHEHPYREGFRLQLMVALYRAGRQTDALTQYSAARRLLVSEYGLDPSPALQELHRAILEQRDGLLLPYRPAAHGDSPRAERPQRRIWLGIAALLAATGVAVGALLLVRSGGHSAVVLGPRSVAVVDAHDGSVLAAVRLRASATGLAANGRDLWIAAGAQHRLDLVDAAALRQTGSVRLPVFPYRPVATRMAVWAGEGFDGAILRIDASSRTWRRIAFDPRATGRVQIAVASGRVWAASQDGVLVGLDARTGKVVSRIGGLGHPEAIAASGGVVWLAEATRDELLRIDPVAHTVRRIPIGGLATALAATPRAVWAATPDEGRLWRVDAATGIVTAAIPVGGTPAAVAASNGRIWAGLTEGLARSFDATSRQALRTVPAGSAVVGIAAMGERVWIVTR
jgi:DNA-binding SARP family transcriptional activator/streptogramin lyase